jgi:DNA (cytosine-5)-methyltransferase 1|tara:strand:- start:1416 stop:2879 length:1464 start_codon:yes stop_codon:yes gene_type:complete
MKEAGMPDFIGTDEVCTVYWVCQGCKKPCDSKDDTWEERFDIEFIDKTPGMKYQPELSEFKAFISKELALAKREVAEEMIAMADSEGYGKCSECYENCAPSENEDVCDHYGLDMKYFSMFSGIGGFEKAIGDKAKCIGYSEIDKYAIQIYEQHFNHKNYGDATAINPCELPDFDLLVGGFPCQAFSVAGKRKGFDDTRGTLFFDIARICAEKRPRYLVLENVKGLLSHDSGKTFQTILGVLADLGYGVEWQVLNSKDFGVPQNRERVYIVGCLAGERWRQVFPITGSAEEDTRRVGGEVSYCLDANYSKGTNTLKKSRRQLIRINGPRSDAERVYDPEGLSCTLKSLGGGMGAKTGLYAVQAPDRANKSQNGRRIKGNEEPMFTLTTQDRHGVMMTRNDGMEVEMDVANTVTPDAYLTSGKRKIVNGKKVLTSMYDRRIRRLTPIECERLQGFPDDWTEGVSDTQRYKCLGNAVTVNVVESIINKIL